MLDKNEYQKDLIVDINILDILWIRQSHLYGKYSEICAEANDLVRRKKNDLEIIDSRLDQEIRVSLEGESKKITEGGIKSLIMADDRHIKALIDYNDSLYTAELCASAVRALEHKKHALQALVQLCLSGYSAMPKVPRNVKEELKKISKEEELEIQGKKDEVRERASRRKRNGVEN